MNEYEKKEFERHKKIAEEQLNNMYYGTKNQQTKTNNLKMPSFLASPQNNNDKPNNSVTATTQNKIPKKNTTFKNTNILNMLNIKNLKMDNDRLIILAVCLLLASDTTDELLMLALIYIML